MFKNLESLLESVSTKNINTSDLKKQVKGLFDNISKRINAKVKHISIEIYKDGDVSINLLNGSGKEVDKGGFLPKPFYKYNTRADWNKIVGIVKDALKASDLTDSKYKVTVGIHDDDQEIVTLNEASIMSAFPLLDRLLEAKKDDDEDEEEEVKEDDDPPTDEEEPEEEEPEEESDDKSDDEPTDDEPEIDKEPEEDNVDGEGISEGEIEDEESGDATGDDDEDGEDSEEEDSDIEEEPEEEDPNKININTTELSKLNGIDLDLAKRGLLSKFIGLKRMIRNNIEIYSTLRPSLMEKKHINLFDSVITDFRDILKNIDTYVDFKLDMNSYSRSLEVYMSHIHETRLLVRKIEKISDSFKDVKGKKGKK